MNLFMLAFISMATNRDLHPEDDSTTKGNQTSAYCAVNDIENCVKQLLKKGATVPEKVNDVGVGIKASTVIDQWGMPWC